ncbi:hypothetical protein [Allobranchiibius sp. GilTou38]|uniref:hypothetical protein n=1 Tax=Allobranchiibius sp. GilTou38 TaxID=2815210 RepID=UPI001AA0C81C|nr:hypothetical protein [Allobranchiibius sp. GilTou38]MBO1767965.1 hypothetical protein [Allobranchiibius sp. GilTou38]
MASETLSHSGRGRRGSLIAVACVALGVAVTGCASSAHDGAADRPGSTASGVPNAVAGLTSTPTAGPQDDTSQVSTQQKLPKGASTAIPSDPLASSAVVPVERGGRKVRPSISAIGGARPFTQPVEYADGLRLRITRMTQSKVTGQGPGVFPGRPVTDFYVTLTNGTKKPLSFDAVVVTVSYGSPARLAHLVYDQNSVDFASTVQPGKSGNAVYGFSVPAADLSQVTMTVDLDGLHQLATFRGKVT